MQNLISSPKKPIFNTGNLCGHNPNLLRDIHFKNEESRIFLIKNSMKALRKKFFLNKGLGPFSHLRSEAREAVFQLLIKYLFNFELSTQTVCNNDITFSRPTLRDITSDVLKTGLSYSRAKKARKLLVEEEFAVVIRSPKYKNGEFKADPSKIMLTMKFFVFLSKEIAESLNFQIHRKIKKLEKRKISLYGNEKNEKRLLEISKVINLKSKKNDFPKNKYKAMPKITMEEENKLRNEYFNLMKARAPHISDEILLKTINRQSIDQIQRMLEQYKTEKETEPP